MFGLWDGKRKKKKRQCESRQQRVYLELVEEAERHGAARSVQPEVTWLHSNSGQADL